MQVTTQHFNQLTEAEQERLSILIEECGEVIQAGCKILRHGYESNNKGQLPETNRQQLAREVGDLMHSLNRLIAAQDIPATAITDRINSRDQRRNRTRRPVRPDSQPRSARPWSRARRGEELA